MTFEVELDSRFDDGLCCRRTLANRWANTLGPVAWGTAPPSDVPGVYVVEAPEAFTVAPIDARAVEAWLQRVSTLRLDQSRPTANDLAARLAEFWIPGEGVVYIGLAGTSLRSRVRGFYRTPLGDPRPHAGGHWLKTLLQLQHLLRVVVRDARAGQIRSRVARCFRGARPAICNREQAVLVLPFANRQDARGMRKPHGIAGSTLTPTARTAAGSARPGREPPTTPPSRSADRLTQINAALQALAGAQPSRWVAAVDAAAELDRLGLLSDSSQRPGLPLRKLLRAGRIQHAYQEAGRWWYIRCSPTGAPGIG